MKSGSASFRARPRPGGPRVRLLSRGATNLDALGIALSYTLIIGGNALGVVVALTLHLYGLAAGAPPVVQVVVDVLGITLTRLVCTAVPFRSYATSYSSPDFAIYSLSRR